MLTIPLYITRAWASCQPDVAIIYGTVARGKSHVPDTAEAEFRGLPNCFGIPVRSFYDVSGCAGYWNDLMFPNETKPIIDHSIHHLRANICGRFTCAFYIPGLGRGSGSLLHVYAKGTLRYIEDELGKFCESTTIEKEPTND